MPNGALGSSSRPFKSSTIDCRHVCSHMYMHAQGMWHAPLKALIETVIPSTSGLHRAIDMPPATPM